MMRLAVLNTALLCFALAVAQGQELVVNRLVGARNAALANANIADAEDISVMYENPATIAFLQRAALSVNHSQEGALNGMQENLAFSLVPSGRVALCVGVDAYHYGFLNTSVPENHRLFSIGYDVVAAGQVSPTVGLGGAVLIRHGISAQNSGAWGTSYALGVNYVPGGSVTYGMVLAGLGADVVFDDLDSSPVATREMMAHTLEVGATMRYPSPASLRAPFLVLSFANQKVFGTSGLYYRGGVEYRPLTMIALRIGYVVGPGTSSGRYGLGVRFNGIAIHYAVYARDVSGDLSQQVSATVEF